MSNPKPVVLLPLRMEIRTVTPQAGREIWIRWYPDDCQVFPPIGRITPDEKEAYERYNAKNGSDKEAAWSELVFEVGVQRARFIADVKGDDPEFVKNEKKQEDLDDGLSQFLAEGSKLKALPIRVALYTIHENKKTFKREVKSLIEVEKIDNELVVAANDIPAARWTVDFEEAVNKGMGVKITDDEKCKQVEKADWLIAVGFKEDKENLLSELFLRNKALGRFSILEQDTPSNNTEDITSDFVENESGTKQENVSFEELNQETKSDYKTNQDLLAGALGIDEKVFRGIKNCSGIDYEVGRIMRGLLFDPCTLTYRDLYRKSRFNNIHPAGQEWSLTGDHFANHVCGGGLLPALQIGHNPYGILPVTKLTEFDKRTINIIQEGVHPAIEKICGLLKRTFMKLTLSCPVIDPDKDDTSTYDTLVQILQLNPVSHRLDAQIFGALLDFGKDPQKLACPLFAQDMDLKDANPLNKVSSYLVVVRQYLQKEITVLPLPDSDNKEMPLFERLLKYYAHYVTNMKVTEDIVGRSIMYIQLLIKLIDDEKVTISELETAFIETIDCLSYRLDAWITSLACSRLEELNNSQEGEPIIFDSIDPQLQGKIERIIKDPRFRNMLRLDNKKLVFKGVMETQQKDLLIKNLPEIKERIDKIFFESRSVYRGIGVYGWLEKPYAEGSRISDGYFQAPSMNQAIAGSVLRSAALSDPGNANGAFQIDLSSGRAKQAMWFTQGIQMGYTPAELLGYQVERKLHDAELDKYLLDLRKRYPLTGQDSYEQSKLIKNAHVVDGEKFIKGKTEGFLSKSDKSKIEKIRSEVSQIQDAVADLYTAETLYQAIQGNTARTAAWLDVVEGKGIPPTPEVLKTPRTGNNQIQRLLYPLEFKENVTDTTKNPRAIAEPLIGDICEKYLAGFNGIELSVAIELREKPESTTNNAEDGRKYSKTIEIIPKNDLKIEPVDLVIGGKQELERLTNIHICGEILLNKDEWEFLGSDFILNPTQEEFNNRAIIKYDYTPDFESILEKAKLLHLYLKVVEPLKPEDLYSECQYDEIVKSKAHGYLILQERADTLLNSLKKIQSELNDLTENQDDYITTVKELLFRMSKYNLTTPVYYLPALLTDEDKKTFKEQLKITLVQDISTYEEKREECRKVTIHVQGSSLLLIIEEDRIIIEENIRGNNPEEVVDIGVKLAAVDKGIEQLVAYIQSVTSGDALPVYPPFNKIENFNIDNTSVDKDTPFMESEFFKSYKKVRKNIATISEVLSLGNLNEEDLHVFSKLGVQNSKEEALIQAIESEEDLMSLNPGDILPDEWIQSNIDFHYIVPETGFSLDNTKPLAGFKIDEWTEFTPNSEEVTGLSFQYDAPQNEAPNAILLAIPPISNDFKWSDTELSEVLADTIDLMRLRSISSETVIGSELGNLLPGLLFSSQPGKKALLPTIPLLLFDGIIKGGFYYRKMRK